MKERRDDHNWKLKWFGKAVWFWPIYISHVQCKDAYTLMFKSTCISTMERKRLKIQRKENEQYILSEPEVMQEYDIQSAIGGGIDLEGEPLTPTIKSKEKKRIKAKLQ